MPPSLNPSIYVSGRHLHSHLIHICLDPCTRTGTGAGQCGQQQATVNSRQSTRNRKSRGWMEPGRAISPPLHFPPLLPYRDTVALWTGHGMEHGHMGMGMCMSIGPEGRRGEGGSCGCRSRVHYPSSPPHHNPYHLNHIPIAATAIASSNRSKIDCLIE